jgi:hypothetical protein
MMDSNELRAHLTRRAFFAKEGFRVGGIALGALAAKTGLSFSESKPAERVHPAMPGLPHFAPKAKALIYLHMNGGPSQLDTWDYKPRLQEFFDKDLPPSVRGEQRLSTMTSGQNRFPVAPSKFRFEQRGFAAAHGRSGR